MRLKGDETTKPNPVCLSVQPTFTNPIHPVFTNKSIPITIPSFHFNSRSLFFFCTTFNQPTNLVTPYPAEHSTSTPFNPRNPCFKTINSVSSPILTGIDVTYYIHYFLHTLSFNKFPKMQTKIIVAFAFAAASSVLAAQPPPCLLAAVK